MTDPAAPTFTCPACIYDIGDDGTLHGETIVWVAAADIIDDFYGDVSELEELARLSSTVWHCYGCGAWGQKPGIVNSS